jgi:hypothetical protein
MKDLRKLRSIPLIVKNMERIKQSEVNSVSQKSCSFKFYQTNNFILRGFYKPISKITNIDE